MYVNSNKTIFLKLHVGKIFLEPSNRPWFYFLWNKVLIFYYVNMKKKTQQVLHIVEMLLGLLNPEAKNQILVEVVKLSTDGRHVPFTSGIFS